MIDKKDDVDDIEMEILGNDDEKVGYCRPPKKTQFKKGVSGNPCGRPKNNPPNGAASLSVKQTFVNVFGATTPAKVDGKKCKINGIEAWLMRLRSQVSGGDKPAMRIMLNLIKELELMKEDDQG